MARQSIYCDICRRDKLHERQELNHVFHLLMSVFCCAFWPFVWFTLIAQNDWFEPWLCNECGNAVPADKTSFYIACALLVIFLIVIASVVAGVIMLAVAGSR